MNSGQPTSTPSFDAASRLKEPFHLEGRRGICFFHHPTWRGASWGEIVTTYAQAFAPSDDVTLALWLDPGQGLTQEEALESLTECLLGAGFDPEQVPDLLLVPDALDHEDLARLYLAVDWVVPHGDGIQKQRALELGARVLEDLSSESWKQATVKRTALADGEDQIIRRFVTPGSIVLDVGANVGSWTTKVLEYQPDVKVHLFEPVTPTYHALVKNLSCPRDRGELFFNNSALSSESSVKTFYHYQDSPTWSTFYRRAEAEKVLKLNPPLEFPVLSTTLDEYCRRMEIPHVHFLKIDVEGGERDVLRGADGMLRRGMIDYLQFEYGGTYLDAGVTLKSVFTYLRERHYLVFKISGDGLRYIPEFFPQLEDYGYANFLAVHERLKTLVLGGPPKMLDFKHLVEKYQIEPKGVIHIGAHEGKEVVQYRAMGVPKILFVEANPAVYERLTAKVGGFSEVTTVNLAVGDQDGTTVLRVTSMDQSSSLLPLKRHKDYYPEISESHQVTVPMRRLDSLVRELGVSPSQYNLLNIDIQGAELLALRGASEVLRFVEAINIEVNFEELYEGCALIHQLDAYLEDHGFERVETVTPYHPSWGDAFYVRKPTVTMSTLGANGRFANQVFQYAFLRTYAKEHGLRYETPDWVGAHLFGFSDAPLTSSLPLFQEKSNLLSEALIPNSPVVLQNVDLWGYFQYHTSYYKPHQAFFRSLFTPMPAVEKVMDAAYRRLRAKGKTLVGLHLRRGDYGYAHFFVAPEKWYLDWLAEFWDTLHEPVLFIASDEPEKVLDAFSAYNPVTSRELGVELTGAEFYPDFYLLSRCDFVAISNSSFSFAACMLNEHGKGFYRPHLQREKLIPFDPWNSEPLLR